MTDDEILKAYCNEFYPEFKPADYELVLNTFSFQKYLLYVRKKELKTALIDSLPMVLRKYLLKSKHK